MLILKNFWNIFYLNFYFTKNLFKYNYLFKNTILPSILLKNDKNRLSLRNLIAIQENISYF